MIFSFCLSSIDLTFGEPTQVDAGFFDSGVDKFKPEQEEAKYEPMDTSGITPMNLLMQAAFAVAGIATDALLTSYLGGDPPRSWSQWASQWGQWIDEKIISGPGPKLDNELSNAVKRGATLQNRQYNTPSAQELQSGKTAAQEALDKAATQNMNTKKLLDANDYVKQLKLLKEVENGLVGKDAKVKKYFDHFDKGNIEHGELPHVHFDGNDNIGLNMDGTWKHTPPKNWKMPQQAREYLEKLFKPLGIKIQPW